MAAGVPAVVTAVGGNPELVIDGRTGWVIPSDDRPALVHAIVTASRDAPERCRRAHEARAHLEENFTMRAMLQAYGAIYESLLADHGDRVALGGSRA